MSLCDLFYSVNIIDIANYADDTTPVKYCGILLTKLINRRKLSFFLKRNLFQEEIHNSNQK